MTPGNVRRGVALLLGAVALAALFGAPLLKRAYQTAPGGASGPSYEPRELLAGGDQPLAPRVDPELEQLDGAGLEAAARYAGEHGSLALIVSRHDHIVFERYWRGTSFDTLSDAQSFTPLLAALATGAALSHRLIGWPDEPLSAFIGEWSQDPRGAITVRNLLQMSSGLGPPLRPQASDLVATALSAPLVAAPGTTRADKAADPQLLALLLERATQQRYASYLSLAVWRRVGAADAWLWLDRPAGHAHADCCLLARQGDWIRIGELLVGDGNYRGAEVIRPGWVALMRLPAKSNAAYGAFVRVASGAASGQEPYAARDLYVAGGPGGNRLWLVPSLQMAILCTGAPAGRDPAWDDSRVPNLIIRTARDYRPPGPPPGSDISSLVPGH